MFRWASKTRPTLRGTGPAIEVGQVGQLETCEKAYEIGKLVNYVEVGQLYFRCFWWDCE